MIHQGAAPIINYAFCQIIFILCRWMKMCTISHTTWTVTMSPVTSRPDVSTVAVVSLTVASWAVRASSWLSSTASWQPDSAAAAVLCSPFTTGASPALHTRSTAIRSIVLLFHTHWWHYSTAVSLGHRMSPSHSSVCHLLPPKTE